MTIHRKTVVIAAAFALVVIFVAIGWIHQTTPPAKGRVLQQTSASSPVSSIDDQYRQPLNAPTAMSAREQAASLSTDQPLNDDRYVRSIPQAVVIRREPPAVEHVSGESASDRSQSESRQPRPFHPHRYNP